MTDNVFTTPSAVIVLLLRNSGGGKQVLCQRRKNTGFGDGKFDFSYSGKVEKGESMTVAAVREAKEELGITVKAEDLKFICLVHKRDVQFDVTYINAYFICEEFEGAPRIAEPDKCSRLEWFDLDALPHDLLDDRRMVLERYKNGESFLEYGWE